MCTLVVLLRPDHPWPLLIAGNRDEMRNRPWLPPGRHWADRPEVVGGFDTPGGGSWLGVNDYGVAAAVMNRKGTLGPAAGRHSRGELVLEALDHADAREAAQALVDVEPRAYRAFNLFIGDPVSAFWLRHQDNGAAVDLFEVKPGLHMLTDRDMDDPKAPRIRRYLPQFQDAEVPDPEHGYWDAWQSLLACCLYPEGEACQTAMTLNMPNGFGTLCSHLVAIPRYPGFGRIPVFLFANGSPDRWPFRPVTL